MRFCGSLGREEQLNLGSILTLLMFDPLLDFIFFVIFGYKAVFVITHLVFSCLIGDLSCRLSPFFYVGFLFLYALVLFHFYTMKAWLFIKMK